MNNEYLQNLLSDDEPNRHRGQPQAAAPQSESPATQPEKITFSDAQKHKVDEIVRGAMGRAAKELRAENASLRQRLESFEKGTSGQQSDTAADLLAAELASTKAERDNLMHEREDAKVSEQLQRAASGKFVNSALAARLMRDSVKVMDGKPVVVGPDGSERLNANLEPMTLADLAQEIQNQHPYLVRSEVRPGVGSTPAAGVLPDTQLERLFGKNGDVAALNRIALHDPQKYRRLRAQAKEQGIIR